MEEKIKLDLEAEEERLLNYLIDNEIKDVDAVIKLTKINYDILDAFKEYEPEADVETLLEALVAKGYLEKNESDRILRCPGCNSINQRPKYICPQCQSERVRRYELYEHIKCGFIGEKTEFTKEAGMRCPLCDSGVPTGGAKKSKPEDFKLIGTSYMCDKCSYKFDKPETRHYCHDCGTVHDFKDSTYEQVFSYKVTPKIMELKPIRAVRDALRLTESILLEKGYMVELNGVVNGKSGEPREVDLLATKDGKTFLVDLSEWGKEDDLISLLGKKMDVNPKAAVLLDLSRSEKLLQMGEVYDVKAFNAREPEYKDRFSAFIDSFEETQKEEPRGFFSFLRRRKTPMEKEVAPETPPVTPEIEPVEKEVVKEEPVVGAETIEAVDEEAEEETIETIDKYSRSKLNSMLKADLQAILITEFNGNEEEASEYTKAELVDRIMEIQANLPITTKEQIVEEPPEVKGVHPSGEDEDDGELKGSRMKG